MLRTCSRGVQGNTCTYSSPVCTLYLLRPRHLPTPSFSTPFHYISITKSPLCTSRSPSLRPYFPSLLPSSLSPFLPCLAPQHPFHFPLTSKKRNHFPPHVYPSPNFPCACLLSPLHSPSFYLTCSPTCLLLPPPFFSLIHSCFLIFALHFLYFQFFLHLLFFFFSWSSFPFPLFIFLVSNFPVSSFTCFSSSFLFATLSMFLTLPYPRLSTLFFIYLFVCLFFSIVSVLPFSSTSRFFRSVSFLLPLLFLFLSFPCLSYSSLFLIYLFVFFYRPVILYFIFTFLFFCSFSFLLPPLFLLFTFPYPLPSMLFRILLFLSSHDPFYIFLLCAEKKCGCVDKFAFTETCRHIYFARRVGFLLVNMQVFYWVLPSYSLSCFPKGIDFSLPARFFFFSQFFFPHACRLSCVMSLLYFFKAETLPPTNQQKKSHQPIPTRAASLANPVSDAGYQLSKDWTCHVSETS